ncbi:hypothetical protein B7494_g1625 [Chlorociboria aeruginascens]|nr:hypothetical protein B7494_g1625 [Chlorociboria aeruginascens]
MSTYSSNTYMSGDDYMCRVCNKWKPPAQYANKELNNYRYLKASGKKPTGITAKLRCRACSGAQVQELRCQGPCDLWKVLDDFSKAQRTRGSGWCQECVLWKEGAEPGITATAAPVGGVDGDGGGDFYDDDEDAEDSDGDEEAIVTPYHVASSMASLSIKASQSSAAETASNAESDYVPPHLRDMAPKAPSTTSASNPYETASQSEWSAADARRVPRASGIQYAAYDANGQRHLRQRVPSSTSTSTTVPANVSYNGGPSSRQTSTTPRPLVSRNGWAKPVGTRRPAVEAAVARAGAPTATQQQRRQLQQRFDYSSDDEP